MPRSPSKQLREVTFRCASCAEIGLGTFKAEPDRVEDAPDRDWHPWEYFCACPRCGLESEQAPHEKALTKAWANSTGPKTPEGKAASAANLDGHPTPEESKRTRFNAMKHGLSAKVANYFPARPGKYSFCSGCDVSFDHCRSQPACLKQSQNFMLHHAAFEQRDPKLLTEMYGDLQAAVFAVLQQVVQQIIADGVKIQRPAWYENKDGEKVMLEYTDENGTRRQVFEEIEAHPLFKPLALLLSRNGLSLADMGMTARVIEEDEQERGRLEVQGQAVELLENFAERQAQSLENLRGLMQTAQDSRKRDPVLIAYNEQNGGQG